MKSNTSRYSKFTWLNLIWADNGLSTAEKAVLQVIAVHADKWGCNAFPSWKTIMLEASIKSKDTLSKHLKSLEEKGFIHKQRRFNKSTIYEIDRDLMVQKTNLNGTDFRKLTDPLTDTRRKSGKHTWKSRQWRIDDMTRQVNKLLADIEYEEKMQSRLPKPDEYKSMNP